MYIIVIINNNIIIINYCSKLESNKSSQTVRKVQVYAMIYGVMHSFYLSSQRVLMLMSLAPAV